MEPLGKQKNNHGVTSNVPGGTNSELRHETLFDVVRDLRDLVQHQFRKQEQLLDQLNRVSQQAPTSGMKMKEFLGLGPPSFDGARDHMTAKLFILELEKIFKVLQCCEEEKVNFAVFMLKGKATVWWHVEETLLKHECRDWETFKLAFSRNYYPRRFQNELSSISWKLEMDDEGMSVGEYQDTFESMAIYGTPWPQTESEMARQFLKGVKFRIKKNLCIDSDVRGSYPAMVERAKDIEQVFADADEEEGDCSRKRSRSPIVEGETDWGPTCPRCSRYLHGEECRWCSGSCFNCGSRGHKKAHCPENMY